jgi:hypothetical protein
LDYLYKSGDKIVSKTKKRFTLFNFVLHIDEDKDDIYIHAFCCIYDSKTHTVELFDSVRNSYIEFKPVLTAFFKMIYNSNVKFEIIRFCPKFGGLYNFFCHHLVLPYKIDGPCTIWVMWYIELRLKNPLLTKHQIVKKALLLFTKDPQRLCRLLRGYAQFIQSITTKYRQTKGSKGKLILKKIE